jgi:hypothetical protein
LYWKTNYFTINLKALDIKFKHIFAGYPKVELDGIFIIYFGKYELTIDIYNQLNIQTINQLCSIFEIEEKDLILYRNEK